MAPLFWDITILDDGWKHRVGSLSQPCPNSPISQLIDSFLQDCEATKSESQSKSVGVNQSALWVSVRQPAKWKRKLKKMKRNRMVKRLKRMRSQKPRKRNPNVRLPVLGRQLLPKGSAKQSKYNSSLKAKGVTNNHMHSYLKYVLKYLFRRSPSSVSSFAGTGHLRGPRPRKHRLGAMT